MKPVGSYLYADVKINQQVIPLGDYVDFLFRSVDTKKPQTITPEEKDENDWQSENYEFQDSNLEFEVDSRFEFQDSSEEEFEQEEIDFKEPKGDFTEFMYFL